VYKAGEETNGEYTKNQFSNNVNYKNRRRTNRVKLVLEEYVGKELGGEDREGRVLGDKERDDRGLPVSNIGCDEEVCWDKVSILEGLALNNWKELVDLAVDEILEERIILVNG
jgi:hypothetical protein